MNKGSRFDQAAAEWDNNPGRVKLARAVGEGIGRAIPLHPNWRVLDYGAGTGLLTLNLQPRVASLVALDSSKGMLEKLAQKLQKSGIDSVQTHHWDLAARAFPETGFDLAVSSMTLHHLRDVPLVLGRLNSLLKPGGWLAVADLAVPTSTDQTKMKIRGDDGLQNFNVWTPGDTAERNFLSAGGSVQIG